MNTKEILVGLEQHARAALDAAEHIKLLEMALTEAEKTIVDLKAENRRECPVKRYEMHFGYGDDDIIEAKDGSWVTYDDYKATEDALRAENERLKNELADAHKQYARVEEVYAKNQCLQIRVGELEGIIKEFLGASYIYESENGEPTNKHKDLVRRAEALTPPATEKEGE